MNPRFRDGHEGERLLSELGWVRRLALGLVRDPGMADDVVQEAWLLARERPPRASTVAGLRAWLVRVTHTLARTRVRGERARAVRERRRSAPEASVPSAHEVVERTQLQQRVVAAVMALDEPYRSAVLLRHVDGLSARAIAARQGTTPANARQRIARGLALLRRELDREHGGDGRSWVLALVPFLRPLDAPLVAASLLGSSAAMKTTSTLLAALAAAVLGVVLWRTGLRDNGLVRDGGDAAGSVLLAAGAEPAERVEPITPAPASREAAAVAAAEPGRRWHVRARLLDAHGDPLAGAELATAAEEPGARADERGFAELVLAELPRVDDAGGTPLVRFVARAPRCRESWRFEPLPLEPASASSDVLELGELRLYPIGTLGVSVRDLSGRPLAGAEVRLTLPSNGGAAATRRTRLAGPDYVTGERRAKSDADGRFLFDDVGEGLWCAWAGARGLAWASSEPLRVARDGGPGEVVLVLEPLPESSLIRGRVLGADGAPLAGAFVSARAGAGEADAWDASAEDGAFALAVEPGVAHRVDAFEAEGERGREPRHGAAREEDVVAGSGELVLVLPLARWIDVAVVSRARASIDGAPVHDALVHARPASGEDGWYHSERDGHARVRVPSDPFDLGVRAEGFAELVLGPFEPTAAPAELVAELVPLARLRGVVRSNGAPVAGARVQLVKLAPPGEVAYLYGFPARLDGTDLQGTESDADGRFELPIAFAGPCVLLAEQEGYATAELGPLALDPARDTELDVQLDAGGAVEGRVLVAEGESAAGILVRFANGDMRVAEAVTDAEGRYRCARLAPGRYMVLAERERAGRSPGFSASVIEVVQEETFRFPWALEVRSGATTRFDVDLAAQERATIAGSLRVDGAAPRAAIARIARAEEAWSRAAFDAERVSLGPDGAFAFGPRRAEPCAVVFEVSSAPLAGVTLVQALVPERGENRLVLELASAAARGTLPAGDAGPFALVVEPAPGLVCVTRIDGPGAFELPSVPAGEARLVAWRAGADRTDPRGWTELARGMLAAGGRTELVLAR